MSVAMIGSNIASAAPDTSATTSWVLSKLARPAPMRTSFVELRGSKLLRQPLQVSGEYRRPDTDTFIRDVRTPYLEVTTIRAGQATISRAGKSRTYPLSRAPELSGLQSSFGALLSGDRTLLQRHYSIATDGTQTQWQMTLVPKDKAMATRVRDIQLYGRGSELRCIETRAPVSGKAATGDVQRTLLATAARGAPPNLGMDAMTALCHGGSQK
ncbi:MAG: LolA-related protein [Luteimonas sp.]